MKTFHDNASRSWDVTINVEALKRVRSLVGVNLLEVIDGELLERLVSDPLLLCDCLFAICKPQADERGVSDEDFGRAMAGDAIDQATSALLEELVDFFPQAHRQVLAKAVHKLREVETRAVQLATQRLDDPRLTAQLEQILQQSGLSTAGDSSGSSADCSTSTPAHSPSANSCG